MHSSVCKHSARQDTDPLMRAIRENHDPHLLQINPHQLLISCNRCSSQWRCTRRKSARLWLDATPSGSSSLSPEPKTGPRMVLKGAQLKMGARNAMYTSSIRVPDTSIPHQLEVGAIDFCGAHVLRTSILYKELVAAAAAAARRCRITCPLASGCSITAWRSSHHYVANLLWTDTFFCIVSVELG